MKQKITIFMVTNFTPADKSIGITKKIMGVIHAFRRKGYEVCYTAYVKNGIAVYDKNDKILFTQKSHFQNPKLVSVFRRFELIRATTKFIMQTDIKFNIVFLRYLGFDLPYIKLLKRIKKINDAYILVDMLGYFKGIRSQNLKGLYMNICTKLFNRVAVRYIDSLLTEGVEESLFGIKTGKAYMGIELSEFSSHSYDGDVDEINMISVANETIYHAYDRLIKSLSIYNNRSNKTVKIKLHLVGVITETTKRLITSENVEKIVFLYGKKYGKELSDIYNKCNLGVGPLGQHRIGGKKDTGLKTKEYFAVGIPYFFSGIESTVPENYPYVFQVPNNESFIDFDKIIRFYRSFKDDEGVADKMREFAKENYSWDKITSDFLTPYFKQTKY